MIRLLIGLVLAIIFLSLFDIHLRVERLDNNFRQMMYQIARDEANFTGHDDGALYRRNDDD